MGDKAAVGVVDDMAEGMQCMDHPYRSNPGGVCAFCLQEKLGKLVSSSKTTPFFSLQPPSSSSSSPASFRSDAGAPGGAGLALGVELASAHSRASSAAGARWPRISFLAATHRKKKKSGGGGGRKVMAAVATTTSFTAAAANDSGAMLKRSKSAAPRAAAAYHGIGDPGVADSPRKKSFWSFLYLSATSSTTPSSSDAINGSSNVNRRRSTSSSSLTGDGDVAKQRQPGVVDAAGGATRRPEAVRDEPESPNGSQASSSFGRKVSRSRSVGCGSRSFSSDFLERISTGFGDCTLRRVESHRESKSKIALHLDPDGDPQRSTMKERVKCGGLFGGFGMMHSAYWLSAAPADEGFSSSRLSAATPASSAAVHGGRSRSWGWAFASPMRAFKPYSTSSSAALTNDVISSINASNKMANGGGSGGGTAK
ncbi:hypothetical protein Cni_G06169 [Canna indica]|uniref:Uncharacterized protein n=1 Tax=Canna indica TaxID=4628 RepID=A0AAQ3JWR9_9LILI|nr:hypothetical protein Cni_G06169 [Canna indica]